MGRKAAGYVEVHGQSIRVCFTFQGQRCREVLPGMPPTARNLQAAERTLAQINKELAAGLFEYSAHFPHSRRAQAMEAASGRLTTLGQYLDAWLASKSHLAAATRDQYKNDAAHWKELLGADTALSRLAPSTVAQVIGDRPWPTNQRFNNCMSPLRGALELARRDNPRLPDWLAGIPHRPPEEGKPDPVTADEMHSILSHIRENRDGRCWAYFAWQFSTGLRPEETVALLWSDIDWPRLKVHVTKTKSFRGQLGETKTGDWRWVDLSPLAIEALEVMKPWTLLGRKEIFQNPWSGEPWHNSRSQHENVWTPALKHLGIEHRRSYCTRHTYATLLLQHGARVAYVSAQMGHTTPSQVERTYARWLPDADGGYARQRLNEAFGSVAVTR